MPVAFVGAGGTKRLRGEAVGEKRLKKSSEPLSAQLLIFTASYGSILSAYCDKV